MNICSATQSETHISHAIELFGSIELKMQDVVLGISDDQVFAMTGRKWRTGWWLQVGVRTRSHSRC